MSPNAVAITQPGVEFGDIATVREVARHFKISEPTLRKKWIDSGKLRALNFGTPGRPRWRIPWAEVYRSQNTQIEER